MQSYCTIAIFVISLLCGFTIGLEYNRQRYNPNTDFLLHEGGLATNGGKNVPLSTQIPYSNKRDYVAEFPELKPSAASKHSTNGYFNQNSGSNVAPSAQQSTPVTSRSTSNTFVTQPGGRRDYVAPQFPTLKPIQGMSITPKTPTTASLSTQASGARRDYVAPSNPTLKPNQGSGGGKVKDLIHLYDNNGNQNTPQKVPNYSSILQGSTNKNAHQFSSTSMMLTQTTPKPMSYSNAVSGPKTPNGQPSVSIPKPSTGFPSTYSTTRPNVILPSSIINKNKNTQTVSSGPATDLELQTLSEELLRKDVNNAAKYVTVNYQEKTTSQSKDDKAPLPLLTISPEAWNIPTIQKFIPLLDNYERDTLVNEYVTPQERNEENAFMDAIMSTSVIRHLMNFLKEKGYVTPDPRQQRDFLKQLWFSLYSRGKGKISSSGFEHVFVSESRNGEVLGLHNWIYFSKEEAANRINYLGYLKYIQLSDKGALMKLHFNQQGSDKPVNSLLIGTSPELEIALYTVCFVTRADNDCKLKLANNDVDIVTHTFRYRSKNLIGSAYPQIPSNFN